MAPLGPFRMQSLRKRREREELAAGVVSEGKTSSASAGREAKQIKGSMRAAHLAAFLALILASGILSAAMGWRLTGALVGKKETKELRVSRFPELQEELLNNIRKLSLAWQRAPHRVKLDFIQGLERYERPTSDEVVVVPHGQIFADALSALMLPARELSRAPFPASKEEETTLRRQLLLVNGGIVAAHVQLTFTTQMQERHRRRARQYAPTGDATDMVSLEGFLRMTVGETETAEEEGQEGPRIPRLLARALTDIAVDSELTRTAAAEALKAFDRFREDCVDQGQPLGAAPDLTLPGGGRFPTARFLSVLKSLEKRINEFSPTPSEAVMQVVEDFSFENALNVLNQVFLKTSEENEITRGIILRALTRRRASKDMLPEKNEDYFRVLLGLLYFDQ
ncbi:hypothetical protein Emed_006851 [Eimeria media]